MSDGRENIDFWITSLWVTLKKLSSSSQTAGGMVFTVVGFLNFWRVLESKRSERVGAFLAGLIRWIQEELTGGRETLTTHTGNVAFALTITVARNR